MSSDFERMLLLNIEDLFFCVGVCVCVCVCACCPLVLIHVTT